MRQVQKCILPILMVIVMIFLLGTHYSYAAPGIMNYQGTLTDNAGQPVTATKDITFKIYANSGDTTAKWTSIIQGVVIKNGVFSVNLGEQNAFTTGLFDDDSLFLGVTVDGVELIPRKQLVSVPYAISAGSGGIPKGGIIMWSGAVNQIPVGWALCNGQNGTPDLRDRFVVGAGNAYGVSASGGSATHAHTINPADINHTHGGRTDVSDSGSPNRTDNGSTQLRNSHTHTFTTGVMSQNASHSHSENAQSNLPPYFALAFIMKL